MSIQSSSNALKAGELDTSFGNSNGWTSTNLIKYFFGDSVDVAKSIVTQPDGKFLVAGSSLPYNCMASDFALVRYNADGSLDKSFGEEGILIDFTEQWDEGFNATLQSDGKILVAGFSTNESSAGGNSNFTLARYTSDGQIDTSFGTNGRITTDFAGRKDQAYKILQQGDNITLVGKSTTTDFVSSSFALARYNTDGSLDTSFGSGGKVTTDFAGKSGALDAFLQSDGKIVTTGYANDGIVLSRYNADGSLDTGFGTNGIAQAPLGNKGVGYSVVQQNDGKILVAGRGDNASRDFAVLRYNSDGSLDSSFGHGGKVVTDFFGDHDSAFSVEVQSDGRIVVAGVAAEQSRGVLSLTRYNPDGSLDTLFGDGGKSVTGIGPMRDYSPGDVDLKILPDGNILVSGSTNGDFMVARFSGGFTSDPTAPVDIHLGTPRIAENSSAGTTVGILQARDPNIGDTSTFELLSNAEGRFALDGDRIVVADGTGLNFESSSAHTIRVRATDQSGFTIEKDLTIDVTDVNEAPTAVNLVNTRTAIAENTSTRSRIKVADISITDDALGTESVNLTGDDAKIFEVYKGGLYVKAGTALDYEAKESYSVSVNAGDRSIAYSSDVSTVFNLNISNVINEPTGRDDLLYGSSANDIMSGSDGSDRLYGFDGNDTLRGDNGNDLLYGGAGNDLLVGGNGNDTLVGGMGSDTLTGGAGNDTFIFTSLSDAGDLITDFNRLQDTLDLRPLMGSLGYSDSLGAAGVNLLQSGANTLLQVGSEGSFTTLATLSNVSAASLVVGTQVLV